MAVVVNPTVIYTWWHVPHEFLIGCQTGSTEAATIANALLIIFYWAKALKNQEMHIMPH